MLQEQLFFVSNVHFVLAFCHSLSLLYEYILNGCWLNGKKPVKFGHALVFCLLSLVNATITSNASSTENSLRVEGLLDLLEPESLRPGIPSPIWPSDHIALMARFRLLKRPHLSRPPVIIRPPHSGHDASKKNQHSNFKSLRKLH